MKALVPLDGSEFSLSVLPNVRTLAGLVPDLQVYLLTVVDQKSVHGQTNHPSTSETTPALVGGLSPNQPPPRIVESHGEALERAHNEATEAILSVAQAQLSGIYTTADVVFSAHPSEAICQRATELGVDVIVMATHGRSGLSHMLLGSVTDAVIRRSGKPVLVNCPK